MRGGRLTGDEGGAVAVLVALLLTALFGMAALAVDIARAIQEQAELQNGADAAALAVAQDCATVGCGNAAATAAGLATSNALDNLASVDGAPAVDHTAQTVTVGTLTADAAGGSRILHWFAPLVGIDGSEIRASATALWGGVEKAKTVPLAISQCDWTTAGGTTTAPVRLPSGTVTFAFHDGNSAGTCNGTSGANLPGGFGWLGSDGSCTTKSLKAGEWAESDPGASPPSDCAPTHFLNKEVQIPVFSAQRGSGANGEFKVWGFATIRITGIRLLMGNSLWQGGDLSLCSSGKGGTGNDQACIVGQFVKKFVPRGVPGAPGSGVPNLGLTSVKLVA